jgi:hypothetical protein
MRPGCLHCLFIALEIPLYSMFRHCSCCCLHRIKAFFSSAVSQYIIFCMQLACKLDRSVTRECLDVHLLASKENICCLSVR